MKHLIVIAGPTASGKTGIAVALAKHFETCVVSADSRQFYKELRIGTAKPSAEEQDGVHHYFVDSHHLNDAVSASKFEEEGLKILEKEFKTNDIVMLAGGSGMFVDALCVGLDPIPTDPIVKESVHKDYKENGLAYLLEELKQSDPDYYRQVDQQNAIRVQRALEVIRITGKPYSTFRTGSQKVRPFKVHRFVLDHPREQLYERINKRVDLMIAAGLEDEAKAVIKWRHLTTMNTVGYKELFEFFDGKTNRTDAIAAIKQNTRRYAKRQLTWLRRHPESHWIKYTDKDAVVREILAIFEGIRSTK